MIGAVASLAPLIHITDHGGRLKASVRPDVERFLDPFVPSGLSPTAWAFHEGIR